MSMKIMISGEPYSSGIRDYGENKYLDKGDTNISTETWQQLQHWHSRYSKFISMTLDELKPYSVEIGKLDEEGINITKQIAQEWFPKEIECFYYYSMCRDFTFVLYPNGTERILK